MVVISLLAGVDDWVQDGALPVLAPLEEGKVRCPGFPDGLGGASRPSISG